MSNLNITPRKITITLLTTSVILAVMSLLGIISLEDGRFLIIRDLFDANFERSVGGWFSTVLLLSAGVLIGLITFDHTQRDLPHKRAWGYLTVIFLVMSMDEYIGVHERFLLFAEPGSNDNSYIVTYILAAIFGSALLIGYWRWLRDLPGAFRTQFIIASTVFLLGAVGVDVIGEYWVKVIMTGDITVTHIVMTTIEEFIEMIGASLIIGSLLTYLRDYGVLSITFAEPAAQPEPLSTAEERPATPTARQASSTATN